MEPLHRLLLGLAHLEIINVDLVLVQLAAGLSLIPNIEVCATPGEALVQKDLIVRNSQLRRGQSHLVVLEVRFFAHESGSLPMAIGALWLAPVVSVATSKQDGCLRCNDDVLLRRLLDQWLPPPLTVWVLLGWVVGKAMAASGGFCRA